MVDLEMDDGLAVITIDRPHARNAISLETMDQFDKALDGAEGAAALVITGAGDRAFVSGGDLKELTALRTERDAVAMAWRMRSICDRIAGFAGPDHRRAERPRARRRRRGRGGRRHPAGRRRHQDRLQPGDARDHARVGRRRAARRVGRLQQGAAACGHGHGARRRGGAAHRPGRPPVPRESFDDGLAGLAKALANRPAGEIKRVMRASPPPRRSRPSRGCGLPTSTGPPPTR